LTRLLLPLLLPLPPLLLPLLLLPTDTDNNGLIDRILVTGARSFSIYRADRTKMGRHSMTPVVPMLNSAAAAAAAAAAHRHRQQRSHRQDPGHRRPQLLHLQSRPNKDGPLQHDPSRIWPVQGV
jgi:hypothetical protein